MQNNLTPVTPITPDRQCSHCRQRLPLSAFTWNKEYRGQRPRPRHICKTCASTWGRMYRRVRPTHTRMAVQNHRARVRGDDREITPDEWSAVLNYFDGKCLACGTSENVEMDHIEPISHGGAHSLENVQPLCRACNSRKGSRFIKDYRGDSFDLDALRTHIPHSPQLPIMEISNADTSTLWDKSPETMPDTGVDTMDDSNRTVSVSEAAAILGVSTDAVRKRLMRGTLPGEKVSGQWRVTLPDDVPDTSPTSDRTQPDASETPSGQLSDIGALAAAFAELSAENARNAAAAAMFQERVRNLETQLLALQPGDVPENEAVESPVSAGNDATYINTPDESEHGSLSIWTRFTRWLRLE